MARIHGGCGTLFSGGSGDEHTVRHRGCGQSLSGDDRRYGDQQVSPAMHHREAVPHAEDMPRSHPHIHPHASQTGCDDTDGLPRYRDAIRPGCGAEEGTASGREEDHHGDAERPAS